MSDCRNGGRDAYDVLRMQADFDGQEFPWMHPLALNGRRLLKLTLTGPIEGTVDVVVNGTRYTPRAPRDWDGEDE